MGFILFIMPFDKEGNWVTLSPLELYRDRVFKSKANPGGGGMLWNEDERHKIHNDAVFYYMNEHGINPTRENFDKYREQIGREVEEEFDLSEREGHATSLLPPQYMHEAREDRYYRLVGD